MALAGFQTKADLVYERLRDAILSGELRPGERVNVDALSRQLGTSKIPLREAVQRLTTQGLVVQPNPHAGAQVAPLSLREMRGVYLARGALEGLAARVAATTVSDAELADLQQMHEQMRQRLVDGDHRDLSVLNRRFHTGIADATHYTTLRELTDLTLLRVQHYRIGVRVEPAWEQVIGEHAAILDALRRRDADQAEQAARDHVEWQLGVELRATLDPSLIDLDDD
ncbi:GntR family transcriptional regulator [Dactylosporangium aurantiacum]|uniref:GntR family transcriptional regulator n=1 Tax=Dactylosporangium aurantiacum TaxID=35754 RepID=A0A9Q9MGC5_9ACTN|nr:GntR family transcriptional regulator [Dactylosporangium aurantiacum]MDG6110380.1 GntR family transcriptional regulator [Dactylosporangium aurantiacum]UWZ58148.1 GntR family transcriptional regulator [Dactylosporangium aurantiacum]